MPGETSGEYNWFQNVFHHLLILLNICDTSWLITSVWFI